MSSNNPDISASDIIDQVESLLGTPNVSSDIYLPWISYAYQRVFQKLANVGQRVKEELFGDSGQISLTQSQLEHSIVSSIPRFGGEVAVEVKYGASGDVRVPATKMRTKAYWRNYDNVSTSYRSKNSPIYYISGGDIGIIPVPPEAGAIAYIDFVKRPYQITEGDDIIDIPYRFTYPIVNFVHAKAVQKVNEDYGESRLIQKEFQDELEEIAVAADSEYNENDGTSTIEPDPDSDIFVDPLNYR